MPIPAMTARSAACSGSPSGLCHGTGPASVTRWPVSGHGRAGPSSGGTFALVLVLASAAGGQEPVRFGIAMWCQRDTLTPCRLAVHESKRLQEIAPRQEPARSGWRSCRPALPRTPDGNVPADHPRKSSTGSPAPSCPGGAHGCVGSPWKCCAPVSAGDLDEPFFADRD